MKSNAVIIFCVFVVFFILENIFPLRTRRDDKIRLGRNLMIAFLDLPFSKILIFPLILSVANLVEVKKMGILNIFKFDGMASLFFSIVILDCAIYWWHVANHKIRFFWRFHQVHHVDRDMDSTTALRFHFGELVLSGVIKSGLVFFLGVDIKTVLLFDLLITCAALFHHSNLKLPYWLENILSFIIVTPLFHQNHHSYYLEETDSNYSTLFSFWDRIFKSWTKPHRALDITIGHPGFTTTEVQFFKLIKMPFMPIKNWPLNFKKRK